MGFPIPEPFIWDTSFKVFYQEIDAEHQGLFEGIFAIGENPGSQLACDNAYAVFNNHFIHEQGAMNASGYKGYKEHTDLHNGFLNDFKARFNAPVALDTMNWAKDWLVNHIKTIDFKYKGKLTTIV